MTDKLEPECTCGHNWGAHELSWLSCLFWFCKSWFDKCNICHCKHYKPHTEQESSKA
ncbi:MAG: hypothetical protein ACREAK_08165 [Nitrosarchaeum sp.]